MKFTNNIISRKYISSIIIAVTKNLNQSPKTPW